MKYVSPEAEIRKAISACNLAHNVSTDNALRLLILEARDKLYLALGLVLEGKQ